MAVNVTPVAWHTPFDAAFNGAAWQVSVVGALNRNNIGTTDNITVELQLFALEDLGGPFFRSRTRSLRGLVSAT